MTFPLFIPIIILLIGISLLMGAFDSYSGGKILKKNKDWGEIYE